MAVVGPVLKSWGGVRRRRKQWLFSLTAVEVAVASAGGAFQRGGVGGIGCRRRHEFPAAIDGVSAEGGGVVFQAFFIGDHHGVVVEVQRRVALQHTVAERRRFSGLDPGWSLSFSIGGFDC